MNNVLRSLKKFFGNKNVVTVLGVIIILALLYYGYNKTINDQIKPTKVPVASVTIQPRTLITDDMITYIDVPASTVSTSVIRSASNLVGQYSDVNTVIPAGSMFYKDVVVSKEDLPDSAFTAVKDGERPYALAVTTASTYGNSIFPGNKIDVYMKAVDENGLIMVGRLLAKVEVLAVKDSAGNNVFEDTSQNRTPATLLFGVENPIYVLLKKAEYLKSYGVELFPVPYGGTSPIEGDLYVDAQDLKDFIINNTRTISETTIIEDADNVENTTVPETDVAPENGTLGE